LGRRPSPASAPGGGVRHLLAAPSSAIIAAKAKENLKTKTRDAKAQPFLNSRKAEIHTDKELAKLTGVSQ